MLTRKDLLQAHRLGTQRAALALISGEPDDPERPLRRMWVATFCGLMVAVIVAAAFGVIGLVRPGGATGLDKAGTLIIEKETGARYVWCVPPQSPKKLCPVANYVSARLLAGADEKSRRTVSRNSLTKFERGETIGIPGAPDTLPDPKALVRTPWSVCVRSVNSERSGRVSITTLLAGSSVGGTQLSDTQAALVKAGEQEWLIWRNKRLSVPDYALSILNSTPTPIADRWLNSVPPGAKFEAPAIPNLGEQVSRGSVSGRVGQLFTVQAASGVSFYVLLSDGLARISEIEKELLRADPRIKQQAYRGATVEVAQQDPATLTGNTSTQPISNNELNAKMPSIVPYTDTSAPLCAVYDDPAGNAGPRTTLGGSLPPASPDVAANGVDLAFPPGGAAVAGLVSGPGRADQITTYYLVTEGRKFAFKSPDTAKTLGYELPGNGAPVQAGVLDLIPAGPVLDPQVANAPISSVPQPAAPSAPAGQSSPPASTPPN